MTARRTAWLACHWTATTAAAVVAMALAALPFTGPYASAAGVAMTGLATAPTPRKDVRP